MNRSGAALDRGLFVAKGQARPTPDYVPRLKTDEPPRIRADWTVPGAADVPDQASAEVRRVAGLAGLIRRRVPPRQVSAEPAEDGQPYPLHRLGVPAPVVRAAAGDDTVTGAVAASAETTSRGRQSAAPAAASAQPKAHARKLTVRLKMGDFARLRQLAESTGRTFQDVIAAAVLAYLDGTAGRDLTPIERQRLKSRFAARQ